MRIWGLSIRTLCNRHLLGEHYETHDMYGNEIYRLGESGYGVSVAFHSNGVAGRPLLPLFTVFHCSDGFKQSLFSASVDQTHLVTLVNVFYNRILELIESQPHGVVDDNTKQTG